MKTDKSPLALVAWKTGTCRAYRAFGGLLLLAAGMLAVGCAAVGPDYTPPEPQAPAAWNTTLSVELTATPNDPEDLAAWWRHFGDPALSDLIDRAVAGNPDVKTARARVREARARRGVADADVWPSLDAAAAYARSRMGGDSLMAAEERSLYSVELDAGWELDLFGGVRRSVEAADADLAAARESLHDTLVSLAAETALNYMDVRTFQTRLTAAESNLDLQRQTLALTEYRHQAGLTDALAVAQARYGMETTQAQIPILRDGLTQAVNRLSVLTGRPPGTLNQLVSDSRPIPAIPATVAVGVPAEALRRRPDVRQSERRLAAQTARIGVATADLYPKLTLTGVIGLESVSSSDLFTAGSRIWRYGPGLSWRVFDGNAIRQNIEIQSALQEQAWLNYEATVLSALEETENALIAFMEEQDRRSALRRAVQAAEEAARLSEDKYRAGLADFALVLDAQRSLVSLEDQLGQSDGAVASQLVRVYKSLGGGWTNVDKEQ